MLMLLVYKIMHHHQCAKTILKVFILKIHFALHVLQVTKPCHNIMFTMIFLFFTDLISNKFNFSLQVNF